MINKNQLDNIIKFSFLMILNEKLPLPSYIIEKWDSFISVNTDKCFYDVKKLKSCFYFFLEVELNDKAKSILSLIYDITTLYKNVPDDIILDDIIEVYKKYIDINEVADYENRHIHTVINNYIDKFIKRNIREYNLLLLDI